MLGLISFIIFYAFMGLIGATVGKIMAAGQKPDDQYFTAALAGIFWPFGLLVLAIWGLVLAYHKASHALAHYIGSLMYRKKIEFHRQQMPEFDAQRATRNPNNPESVEKAKNEILAMWDYPACDSCFGRGCKRCNNTGIKRVQVKRPSTETIYLPKEP